MVNSYTTSRAFISYPSGFTVEEELPDLGNLGPDHCIGEYTENFR